MTQGARKARSAKGARTLRVLAIAGVVMAMLMALSGCVYSETITERIIDSNPDSAIDYDLEPILINSATATETTDKLPKLDEEESDQEQDTQEDFSELTDQEPTSTNQAPTPQYNANAEEAGVADSPASNTTTTTSDSSTGWSSTDTDDVWDDVDESEDDDSSDSTSENEGTDDSEQSSGRKSGSSGDYYKDTPDMDDPEIPEGVDEVVAFGNNAVIVSILTGSESGSALIGCDSATKQATSSVLAARGMGSVQVLDYTVGSTMSSSAFKKLANTIVPDLVYVTEGLSPFTSTQLATLSKKNISVYTLPALTSDARIRFTFQVIAKTLEAGGVDGVTSKCSEYESFCNSLIDGYTNANGGFTGGFDFDEAREVDTGASDLITLVIDGWDESARYKNSKAGSLDSSTGVAVATLGYEASPLNYYLSAGGVLNNAGSKKIRKVTTSGKGLVWQFASGELSGKKSNWSSLSASYVDLASKVTGGLFADSLLCYTSDYKGLGTSSFPALVASSQKIASLLQSSASNANGLYRAYGTITPAGHGSTVGYFPDASADFYVESCIGRGTSGGSDMGEGGQYGIYVNPKGLCQQSADNDLCSWVSGSPESVLETSWAYWKFRGGSQSAFEQDVKDFYQKFYGYDLSSNASDLANIEAGVAN